MKKLMIVAAISMLTACMSMGTKVETKDLTGFTKGKTTYSEVVNRLGTPTQSTVNSDGTKTAIYFYTEAQAKAATFIPIVGMFAGGADSENTTVTLTFDQHSVLSNYSSSTGQSSVSTGF
jgi:hypothetical protein